MPAFWLDTSVLIRPNREGFYSFALAPTFWETIQRRSANGELSIPREVCNELINRGDDLASWAEERENSGLFVDPDQSVQDSLTQVSDYVVANYIDHRAQEFLGGADPWVIAHAIVDGARIVTYETSVDLTSTYPKIPNVARAFHIQSVNLFRMLQMLNITVEFR